MLYFTPILVGYLCFAKLFTVMSIDINMNNHLNQYLFVFNCIKIYHFLQIRRKTTQKQWRRTHRDSTFISHSLSIEEALSTVAHPHYHMDRHGASVHRCRFHPSFCFLCAGNPLSWIRNDLFWSCKRYLQFTVWDSNEIYWKSTHYGTRSCCSYGSANLAFVVEAPSR